MQQLLSGTAPGLSNGAFVHKLFLQRLPSNVRMVLASAKPDTSVEELTQKADKIVGVATPSVSAVATTPPHITAEIEQLCLEVGPLTNLVKSLTQCRHSPSPNCHHPLMFSASTTNTFETLPIAV